MTEEPTTDLQTFMSDVTEGKTADDFYYYEPWDTDEEDRDEGCKGFQVGFHASTELLRIAVAGNRTGKSQMMAVEAVIMATGEIPFCLRYEEGFESKHIRPHEDLGPASVGYLNRIRWGHMDHETKKWTPPLRYPSMPPPKWPKEAPCGYIIGCGVYDTKKIARSKGSSVWVCTYKATRDERWIKLISSLLPAQFKDTTWNPEGFSVKGQKFKLTNTIEITFITYEMGPERAQGAGVHAVFADEEPQDRKFWTEIDQRLITAGFEGYMSMSFTPLLGLSWSYYDLYKPAMNGELKGIDVFHATQFDSPFITKDSVTRRMARYKPWEIQARVWGRYSEMQGRPYYDYIKLNGAAGRGGWVRNFVPRRSFVRYVPAGGVGEHEEHLIDLLGRPINEESVFVQSETLIDYFSLYEKGPFPEHTYYASMDTAEGAEEEENALDRNAGYIWRFPMEDEDPEWPIMMASIRTGMTTQAFARTMWYACQYWNYCVMVPEVTGGTGATFAAEVKNWPFLYHSVSLDDKTQKRKAKWGFEMKVTTRQPCWDLVGDFIDDHQSAQCMRHEYFLRECASAVYGKNGRPDHPKRGTSDCITAAGIGFYVYRHNKQAISNNFGCQEGFKRKQQEREVTIFDRYAQKYPMGDPTKRPLGQKAGTFKGLPR